MKKKLERWIFEIFMEVYTDFLPCDFQQSDRPDFIVTCQGKTIGIEIAEVFQDSHLGKSSKLKERERVHEAFGNELLQCLVSKQRKKQFFMLDVSFSNDHFISKRQIKALVGQCWIPCMEFIWNNTQGSIRIDNDSENFPDIINSVFIQLADYRQDPIYCNNQGGMVDSLRFEHIERTLKVHEEALKAYQKCDEYWLVIREGNYYAGSFSDISFDIQIPIISAFDKVFVLRTRNSSSPPIIRLK